MLTAGGALAVAAGPVTALARTPVIISTSTADNLQIEQFDMQLLLDGEPIADSSRPIVIVFQRTADRSERNGVPIWKGTAEIHWEANDLARAHRHPIDVNGARLLRDGAPICTLPMTPVRLFPFSGNDNSGDTLNVTLTARWESPQTMYVDA